MVMLFFLNLSQTVCLELFVVLESLKMNLGGFTSIEVHVCEVKIVLYGIIQSGAILLLCDNNTSCNTTWFHLLFWEAINKSPTVSRKRIGHLRPIS